LLLLLWCGLTEIAQRIFKCGDLNDNSLSPDRELKTLVYTTLFYVNMYGTYRL